MSVICKYNLDDDGVWADDSGNANDCDTEGGTPTTGVGHGGGADKAFLAASVGDYAYIAETDQTNMGAMAQLLLGCWIYPTDRAGEIRWIASLVDATAVFYCRLNASNLLEFQIYSAGGDGLATSVQTISLNEWTHVGGMYNGKHVGVFINGVCDAVTAYTQTMRLNTGSNFLINGTGNNLIGRMDDLIICDDPDDYRMGDLYNMGDDFAAIGATGSISGVVLDRKGTVVDCSTYPTAVRVFYPGAYSGKAIQEIIVTASNGQWSFSNLVDGQNYMITQTLLDTYSVLGETNIGSAEFHQAAA